MPSAIRNPKNASPVEAPMHRSCSGASRQSTTSTLGREKTSAHRRRLCGERKAPPCDSSTRSCSTSKQISRSQSIPRNKCTRATRVCHRTADTQSLNVFAERHLYLIVQRSSFFGTITPEDFNGLLGKAPRKLGPMQVQTSRS